VDYLGTLLSHGNTPVDFDLQLNITSSANQNQGEVAIADEPIKKIFYHPINEWFTFAWRIRSIGGGQHELDIRINGLSQGVVGPFTRTHTIDGSRPPNLGARWNNAGSIVSHARGTRVLEGALSKDELSDTDWASVEQNLRDEHAGTITIPPLGTAHQILTTNLVREWDSRQDVYSDAGTTPAIVDTDTVQQWIDQTGNADPAEQLTAGFRPNYQTQDGVPVLWFDKIDDYLQHNYLGEVGTIYALIYLDNPGALSENQYVLGADNGIGNHAYVLQANRLSDGNTGFRRRVHSVTLGSRIDNQWYVLGGKFNSTSERRALLHNGVEVDVETSTAAASDPIAAPAVIGAGSVGGVITGVLGGGIAKVLMYDVDHDQEQLAHNMLALKQSFPTLL
jgi:hypothetical protein